MNARSPRISIEDAVRLGLIDFEEAESMKASSARKTPRIPRGTSLPRGSNRSVAHGAPGSGPLGKESRRRSAPAIHPDDDGFAPPGEGRVNLDENGRIRNAHFFFRVVPVPKERARVVRRSKGKIMAFTPKRTRHFDLRVISVIKMASGSAAPCASPLSAEIIFRLAVPSSWPRWKKEAALSGLIAPASRPDLDNLEKALLDAMNGIVFEDDSLVTERRSIKVYAEKPGIEAKIMSLNALPPSSASRSMVSSMRDKADS